MGRASRAKHVRRVKVDKADFFELIAALRLHEVIRLEAQAKAARIAAELVQKEIAESGRKGRSLIEALAKRHGFDVNATIRWDEQTCELIIEPVVT